MTYEDFFKLFEKHLEVASPEREEIIHELQTHADELDAERDFAIEIGDPIQLAQRYNRVHIGALYSRARMLLTPVLLWFFLLALRMLPWDFKALAWTSNLAALEYYFQQLCTVFLPIALAAYLGRILVRRKNSGFEFICLLGEAVALIGAYVTLSIFIGQGRFYDFFSMGLWVGILGAIGISIIFIASMVFAKPISKKTSEEATGGRLTLEIVVFLFVSLISFMGTGLIIASVFAPYEALISKPPDGTILRIVNDFFDSSRSFLPWLLFEIGLIWTMGKRMQKYYALHVRDTAAWVSAFVGGIGAALLDGYTLTYTPVFLLLFFTSATLGFLKPTRPWRWAFMLAATIPIIQIMLSFVILQGFGQKNDPGVGFLVTFPAAYLGRAIFLFRKQHSEKKMA